MLLEGALEIDSIIIITRSATSDLYEIRHMCKTTNFCHDALADPGEAFCHLGSTVRRERERGACICIAYGTEAVVSLDVQTYELPMIAY